MLTGSAVCLGSATNGLFWGWPEGKPAFSLVVGEWGRPNQIWPSFFMGSFRTPEKNPKLLLAGGSWPSGIQEEWRETPEGSFISGIHRTGFFLKLFLVCLSLPSLSCTYHEFFPNSPTKPNPALSSASLLR